jgi:hypothetical protein
MKNQLDITKALSTFNKIREKGKRTEEGYVLEGICAQTDLDGYTATMTDQLSHLTIFFHNKYELEGPDKAALEKFNQKLQYIADHY